MQGKKFAAFDIDGTLVRWQLYHALVDQLHTQGLINEIDYSAVQSARMKWKNREHKESFKEYEAVLISTYERTLPKIPTTGFDQAVKEVAGRYKQQVYTFTRDLIEELRSKSYVLIAISGSHKEVVEHIAKQFGFSIWVGTEYKRDGGSFTGERTIGSKDKGATLLRIVKDNGLSTKDSYAVGDSKNDAELLRLVDNPIAFNPDSELQAIAKANEWPIVVERKNVVYRLENSGGRYELV